MFCLKDSLIGGVRVYQEGSHLYEIYKPEGSKQYGEITEIKGEQKGSHGCY